jgi:hypothetical protein
MALPDHIPGVSLDAWVVMPDHLHGIVVINPPDCPAGHPIPDDAQAKHASPLQPPPQPVGATHASPAPVPQM